jgi:hypothetical protein
MLFISSSNIWVHRRVWQKRSSKPQRNARARNCYISKIILELFSDRLLDGHILGSTSVGILL